MKLMQIMKEGLEKHVKKANKGPQYLERLEKELGHYEVLYTRAVDACMELQSGGRFAYLLKPGDSLTVDGPKALMAEIDRLKEKLLDKRSWRRV